MYSKYPNAQWAEEQYNPKFGENKQKYHFLTILQAKFWKEEED